MISALLATTVLRLPVWSVVGDRLFATLPKRSTWTRQTFLAASKKIGLKLSPHSPPFRLGGSSSWVVCCQGQDQSGMAIQFSRNGAIPIYAFDAESLLPLSGFVDGERVILGGNIGWMGNGPSPAACIVIGRKVIQTVSVDFEGWDCVFDKRVAMISGRTYPTVINVCHAMANVEMVSRFTYNKGRLSVAKPRRTMNPMAILDDLALAACRRDYHALRRLTTTDKLAREVAELGVGLKEAGWEVPGSICSVTNTVFEAQPLARRLTFVRWAGVWKLGKLERIRP